MTRRDGVTLIEFLVVIVILGILVSLSIPAIQKVREAAAHTNCANNIRDLNVAVQNYAAVNQNQLPACKIPLGNAGTNWASIMVALMPYVGQEEIYRQYQSAGAIIAPSYQQPIKTFICPSDPSAPKGITLDGWGGSSYSMNSGLFSRPNPLSFPQDNDWDWTKSSYKTDEIPDGSSNVIAIAERMMVTEGFCSANRDLYPVALGYDGYGWSSPVFANYQTAYPEGGYRWAFNRSLQAGGKPALSVRWVPSSPHAGVILVGMADGSGRTIRSTMNPDTFWRAVSPADHLAPGIDW